MPKSNTCRYQICFNLSSAVVAELIFEVVGHSKVVLCAFFFAIDFFFFFFLQLGCGAEC